MAFKGKLIYSGLFIFRSFFRFLRWILIRLLNVYSEIEKQLDSLEI